MEAAPYLGLRRRIVGVCPDDVRLQEAVAAAGTAAAIIDALASSWGRARYLAAAEDPIGRAMRDAARRRAELLADCARYLDRPMTVRAVQRHAYTAGHAREVLRRCSARRPSRPPGGWPL